MRHYNRGEWSELYVAVKLLVEGVDGKIAKSVTFPAPESSIYSISGGDSLQRHEDFVQGRTGRKASIHHLKKLLSIFLNEIIEGGGKGAFTSEAGEKIMRHLGIGTVKSKSGVKADLLCDGVRYSVKSFMGSSPSIVNPSNSTCAVFRVKKGQFSRGDKIRVSSGAEQGLEVEFLNWSKEATTLVQNLNLICDNGADIMGRCLQEYINGGHSRGWLHRILKDSDEQVIQCVKRVLTAFYWGMVPNKRWNPKHKHAEKIVIVSLEGKLTSSTFENHVKKIWSRLHFEQDGHMSQRRVTIDGGTRRIEAGVLKEVDSEKYLAWPLQIRESALSPK